MPERLQKKIGNLLRHSPWRKKDRLDGIGGYFGRYPELICTVDGSTLPWDETCLLPTREAEFEDPWNYFEADDFEVNWTYESVAVDLAVNQISISGERTYNLDRAGNAGVKIRSDIFTEPSLSIGDNSGAFELNLQRSTYAASELPFCGELLREVTDEFLFQCLWQLANIGFRGF